MPEQLYAQPQLWHNSIHPDDLSYIEQVIRESVAGKPFCVEYRIRDAHGNWRWFEDRSFGFKVDGEDAIIDGLAFDITDRKQAETALSYEHEMRQTILDNIPVMLALCDRDGHIQLIDRCWQSTLGWSLEEMLQHKDVFAEFYPDPEYREHVMDYIKKAAGAGSWADFKTRTRDGHLLDTSWINIPLSDGSTVGIGIDITERKQAEAERIKMENRLSQSQKMEAIGTLAGGIAHDFNNILAAIIGYTELAMDGNQKEIQRKHLQETLKGAERAKNLVKQILTFSRQDDHEKKPLDIKILLKDAVKFLRSSIPTTIEIHQNITEEYCSIMADPTQMHQIIMNLCTNASHAMKDAGGILDIELTTLELAEGDLPQHHDLRQGHYVKLTVSDTGHGIDPDHIQRIFDPFFTTKSKDEGTGLGLSVVYGIVKSHDGVITVYSEPKKGTTFNVYFPRIIYTETTKVDSGKTVAGGTERILLVDDELSLVNLVTFMLSPLGYKVTGVTSSVDALDIFSKSPQSFDLVITDMTLPKMTGIDLSREILKIRPDIPIILCSGMRESDTEDQVKFLGIKAYLTKPLTRKELARVVRETLDGQGKQVS